MSDAGNARTNPPCILCLMQPGRCYDCRATDEMAASAERIQRCDKAKKPVKR